MGDPFAFFSCAECCADPLSECGLACWRKHGLPARELVVYLPFDSGGVCDFAMTIFADDIQRLVLADSGEGLYELVERIRTSSESLSESLRPYGYRQNEDKVVTLPVLAGTGSRVAARAIRRSQGAGCPGVVADNTRNLGAWINAWG